MIQQTRRPMMRKTMIPKTTIRKTAWISALSAVVLCATFLPSAQADSLSQAKQHLNDLQQQNQSVQSKIQTAQQQANVLSKKLAADQASIDSLTAQINTTREQLTKASAKLASINQQITDNQSTLQTDKTKLEASVRAQYEEGNVSLLSALFQATSWTDLLSRFDMLGYVAKSRQSLVRQTQAVQETLTGDQKTQTSDLEEITFRSNQLREMQTKLETLQKQHQVELEQTNQQVHTAQKQRSLLESQIKLTQSQIKQIEEATRLANEKMHNQAYLAKATKNLKSVDAKALIDYAEKFVGLPYIWGGTTPTPGFDCSGFTQYVMAHFGVTIGRDTWDQYAEGVPVDRSNLKPGDLVFFSTYASGASHVGIYVGNGMMVDSEDAGLIVTPIFTSSYWDSRYLGARRFIK